MLGEVFDNDYEKQTNTSSRELQSRGDIQSQSHPALKTAAYFLKLADHPGTSHS